MYLLISLYDCTTDGGFSGVALALLTVYLRVRDAHKLCETLSVGTRYRH
jgi:hypothetical protein